MDDNIIKAFEVAADFIISSVQSIYKLDQPDDIQQNADFVSLSVPKETLSNIPSPKNLFGTLYKIFVKEPITEQPLIEMNKLLVHVQQAYWHYNDIYTAKWESLPPLDFAQFMEALFRSVPMLLPYHLAITNSNSYQHTYNLFYEYQRNIGCFGGILISEDMNKVLLVLDYSNKFWMFPGGKTHNNDTEMQTAIREVYEETSYDITNSLDQEQFLVRQKGDQKNGYFVIRNVPYNYEFHPSKRRKVSKIAWHEIATIPNNTYDDIYSKVCPEVGIFSNIVPYMSELKDLIQYLRNGQ
eukprot:TRINITY_DN3262_c0_g1_i3.p1 TRINITY_DN3262_c0_g1~~TRINITY_DN3262_c0_g1_i3.p1  ORF type:complete len:329 (-),score=64.79 TRINITY_DN3262_c0_g1_i3:13-903(-)